MSKHVLRKHSSNFTIVSNEIIKLLKNDLSLLGLYLYLFSLPDNWVFYKTTIAKECSIGIKRLERYFKKLKDLGLLNYEQVRGSNGRFSHCSVDIYETQQLKINNLEDLVQPEGQINQAVETDGRSGEAIKKELIKEEYKEYKENISCSSDDEPQTEMTYFDLFWSIYPRKQKKKDAKRIWDKKKYDQTPGFILEDIRKRVQTEWRFKDKEFIPLASSYLNGERWNDEIIQSVNSKGSKSSSVVQAVQSVLEIRRENGL